MLEQSGGPTTWLKTIEPKKKQTPSSSSRPRGVANHDPRATDQKLPTSFARW